MENSELREEKLNPISHRGEGEKLVGSLEQCAELEGVQDVRRPRQELDFRLLLLRGDQLSSERTGRDPPATRRLPPVTPSWRSPTPSHRGDGSDPWLDAQSRREETRSRQEREESVRLVLSLCLAVDIDQRGLWAAGHHNIRDMHIVDVGLTFRSGYISLSSIKDLGCTSSGHA
jgi:hypothetical protein